MTHIALSLGRKIGLGVATVVFASAAIFCTVQLLPQDPAVSALGPYSTPTQRAAFDQRMGLDKPAVRRYVEWLGGMAHGDFGKSVISGNPVGGQVKLRLKYTALLASLALILGTLLALPLALFAARRSGSRSDIGVSSIALGISALPEYVLGLLLLLVFGVEAGVFPVSSGDILTGDYLALALPTLTLALVVASYIYRMARVSVAESLAAPYVRTAILNGLSPRQVLWKHVVPNASVVVVNVVAQNALYLLGGVIVVENVFSYPGLGTLLVGAVGSKDFVVIQDAAVVLSALFVAINLLADMAVMLLSPRLRARRA